MSVWRILRTLTLALVVSSPLFLQHGCGGGGTEQPETGPPAEEDATLNPEEDSTMTTESTE